MLLSFQRLLKLRRHYTGKVRIHCSLENRRVLPGKDWGIHHSMFFSPCVHFILSKSDVTSKKGNSENIIYICIIPFLCE